LLSILYKGIPNKRFRVGERTDLNEIQLQIQHLNYCSNPEKQRTSILVSELTSKKRSFSSRVFPKLYSKAFYIDNKNRLCNTFLRHLKTFNAVLRITITDVKIMRFVLLMQKVTTTQLTCPLLKVYAIVLIHEKHTINNKFRFCTTHFTLSLKYLYMKIFGKSNSVSGLQ